VEQRDRCTRCGQPAAATKGPPFSRLRPAAALVTTVLTRLCHGCPLHALVAAFGRDERTVASWRRRAGQHGQPVQPSGVQQGHVDRPHVQADERGVTRVGRRVWMARAVAVPSRLWWGGVLSPPRDLALITRLVQMLCSGARTLAIVVCVAGLASSVPALLRVFRSPVRTDRPGRPRLVLAQRLRLGQVVTR